MSSELKENEIKMLQEYANRVILPDEDRAFPFMPEAVSQTFIAPESGSEAWHRLRLEGIGSSDAPIILGVSPFLQPVALWKKKLEEEEAEAAYLEPYSWFGSWLEKYIISSLKEELKGRVIPGTIAGPIKWANWGVACANLDAILIDDDNNGTILEIKTTGEKWKVIPEHYYAQVQHQLMVTGMEHAKVVQFTCPVDRRHIFNLKKRIDDLYGEAGTAKGIKDDALFRFPITTYTEHEALDPYIMLVDWVFEMGEVQLWDVERDEAFIEKLFLKEKAFWECVETGVEPVPDACDLPLVLPAEGLIFEKYQQYASICDELKPFDELTDKKKEVSAELKTLLDRARTLSMVQHKKIEIGDTFKATYVNSTRGAYWRL